MCPLVEIHQLKEGEYIDELIWSYIPRRQDGQNGIRKQRFEEYYGDTTVKINVPVVTNQVSKFLEHIIELSEARIKASNLEKIEIKQQIFTEEIDEKEIDTIIEGAKKQITVNAYERSNDARKRCIAHHGTKCVICGFDATEVYGKEFIGKIHVHHIKPLNEIGSEYEVNPVKDLVPVCPNCHMIIHSKNPTYTIEEIKNKIIKE